VVQLSIIHARLPRFVTRDDRLLLEKQNSGISIINGLIFLVDFLVEGGLFQRAPVYQYLEWMPTGFWAVICLSLGILHYVSIYARLPSLRKQILWLEGGMWVYLGTCILFADAWRTGSYVYFLYAAFALRSYLRVQVGIDDTAHKTAA